MGLPPWHGNIWGTMENIGKWWLIGGFRGTGFSDTDTLKNVSASRTKQPLRWLPSTFLRRLELIWRSPRHDLPVKLGIWGTKVPQAPLMWVACHLIIYWDCAFWWCLLSICPVPPTLGFHGDSEFTGGLWKKVFACNRCQVAGPMEIDTHWLRPHLRESPAAPLI